MAKNFSELRAEMSAERREQNQDAAQAILASLDLAGLRAAMGVTQEELAERLAVRQSTVSRLERRSDMLISSLRDVIAAYGGELHVLAVFPDGAVELLPFGGPEVAAP